VSAVRPPVGRDPIAFDYQLLDDQSPVRVGDACLDDAPLVEFSVRRWGITDRMVDEVLGEDFVRDDKIALVPDDLVEAAKHGLVFCLAHRTIITSGRPTSENAVIRKFRESPFHAPR
jgi:hypothetical protein